MVREPSCTDKVDLLKETGVQVLGQMPEDHKIYRYMDVERYFDLVEKGILSLSHITMWEDPYEGFIFRAAADAVKENAFKTCIYDLFKYYYGQSWTTKKEEADETWRAHGRRGKVVRIKTTIDKLCRCVTGGTSRVGGSDAKIGLVRYAESDEEFAQYLQPKTLVDALNGDEQERLKMFFIKRPQFKSEAEFRIMIHADENGLDRKNDTDGRFLKIPVDPKELIDEVLVDPCMERKAYEQLICRTRHFDCDVFPIQSSLFDWPQLKINDLNEGGKEYRFWTRLQKQYPDDALKLQGRKPSHRSYWQISHGQDLFFFYFNNSEARVEYYIPDCNQPLNLARYQNLVQHKEAIEEAIGVQAGELSWDELPGRKACKVFLRKENVSLGNEGCWDDVCQWLCDKMVKLVKAITTLGTNVWDLRNENRW